MQQALQPPDEVDSDADTEQENTQGSGEAQDQQQVFAVASTDNVRKIKVDTVSNRYASGKRSTAQDASYPTRIQAASLSALHCVAQRLEVQTIFRWRKTIYTNKSALEKTPT